MCIGFHLAVEAPTASHAAKLVEQRCKKGVASSVQAGPGGPNALQTVWSADVCKVKGSVVWSLVRRLLRNTLARVCRNCRLQGTDCSDWCQRMNWARLQDVDPAGMRRKNI